MVYNNITIAVIAPVSWDRIAIIMVMYLPVSTYNSKWLKYTPKIPTSFSNIIPGQLVQP